MNIVIVGYDLRALSLSRLFLREGNLVKVITGFRHFTFQGIESLPLSNMIFPLYENVKNVNDIVFIIKNIKPHLVVCLHIESYEAKLVDILRSEGIVTFGIISKCSSLETSKIYGISFAKECGLNTPKTIYVEYKNKEIFLNNFSFNDKIVIKENGLAGGKGTYIIDNRSDFFYTVNNIKTDFLVQDFIDGEEIAFSFLVSGGNIYLLNLNFEIKRKEDGDKGENTSGMGTFALNALYLDTSKIYDEISKKIIDNLLSIDYCGPIDLNFIINNQNQFVFLEFTCRFGDPELNSELLLINSISDLFYKMALNQALSISFKKEKWAVGLVARNLNQLIKSSDTNTINYILDMLDFYDYDECCLSAIGNNYLVIINKIYEVFNKLLPKSSYYRKDIEKNIEKRLNKFNQAINM